MRPIGALLQRGFDNTVANWPLILITVAGQIGLIVLFLILLALTIIPAVMMVGLTFDWNAIGADPENYLSGFILEHPFLILYALLAMGIVLIPVIMLMSFLEAAKFGTYVDGERARGEGATRIPMKVFDPGRWARWGRHQWWSVFWILNILWGVAMLIMLVFAVVAGGAVVGLALAAGDAAAGVAAVVGCISAIFLFSVIFVLMIATAAMTSLAVAISVRDGGRAVESVRESFRFVRRHPGTVILVTVITIVVSIALGGIFSIFGMLFQFGEAMDSSFLLALAPLQIVFTLLQALVSAAVQSWTSATFTSAVVSETSAAAIAQHP